MKAARFVFCYDHANLSVGGDVLEAFIKNNRHVTQWARIFPGLYLLKSHSDAKELAHSMNDLLVPAAFVICRLKTTTGADWNGILKRAIWDWVSEDNADDAAPLALEP